MSQAQLTRLEQELQELRERERLAGSSPSAGAGAGTGGTPGTPSTAGETTPPPLTWGSYFLRTLLAVYTNRPRTNAENVYRLVDNRQDLNAEPWLCAASVCPYRDEPWSWFDPILWPILEKNKWCSRFSAASCRKRTLVLENHRLVWDTPTPDLHHFLEKACIVGGGITRGWGRGAAGGSVGEWRLQKRGVLSEGSGLLPFANS